jgi:hypothetical protein
MAPKDPYFLIARLHVLAIYSGLLGHRRTYLTILESADHALFKMVRYVLLRPLRPELDGQDVEAGDSKIFHLKRPLDAVAYCAHNYIF